MKNLDLLYQGVQHQIGNYEFKNRKLLEQAFTRKSYTQENGGQNNEILEFIGDKVLDICVVRYLVTRYGTDLHVQNRIPESFRVPQEPMEFESQLDEGELSKAKQKMVEKRALARRMDELDLIQFLIMGQGDVEKNIAEEPSVKEDLFEAIIGAVALDSNWDFETLQQVVEVMLCPDSFLGNPDEADYVGLIYEWEAQKNKSIPLFKYYEGGVERHWYSRENGVIYVDPVGTYNLNHKKHACRMMLREDLPQFEAYGLSKNEARREACKAAYEFLKKQGLLWGIKDEIDNPNMNDAINQLEILARRGYFSLPTFDYIEKHDNDGNPVWEIDCSIDEVDQSFSAEGTSKKGAKKAAAYKMLMYVLDAASQE